LEELKEDSGKMKELKDRLPEFYLSQEAVYVIEDQNMTLHMLQEHALIFAVSPNLVDVSSLAKYWSEQFPTVKFNLK
jgi:hypothetical protein